MSWTIEYDEDLKIVVLTYLGYCTGEDFRQASSRRIAIAEEKGSTKTLIDASKLECNPSTIVDIYNIVENNYGRLGNRSQWKIAITAPKLLSARQQADFYETVCKNRGWEVKEFEERKDAIEWLTDDS